MAIDSKKYGLNNRIVLQQLNDNHIGIIKKIKSRIISKNATKIVEIAEAIKAIEPNVTVSLVCTSNICSKSVKLLTENNIDIITENLT